jgi:hypothetical protein
MDTDKKPLISKFLFFVAVAYLLFNVYQATITTIFISHFPQIVSQLPKAIESSQPTLQLTLFLLQEITGSIGIYLRLGAGILALYSVILFTRRREKYLHTLGNVLLFESLYFALLIPTGINHVVGSIVSSSAFLNVNTGISFLLQAILVFPSLFILSRKLRTPQHLPLAPKWACIAAPLYVFGLWVKHFMMWVYALSPSEAWQTSLIDTVGFVNLLLTLLIAAIVTTASSVVFRRKNKANTWLVGAALILIGAYFAVYAIVSVWVPIYLAFLPLTEFWMVALLIPGIALMFSSK